MKILISTISLLLILFFLVKSALFESSKIHVSQTLTISNLNVIYSSFSERSNSKWKGIPGNKPPTNPSEDFKEKLEKAQKRAEEIGFQRLLDWLLLYYYQDMDLITDSPLILNKLTQELLHKFPEKPAISKSTRPIENNFLPFQDFSSPIIQEVFQSLLKGDPKKGIPPLSSILGIKKDNVLHLQIHTSNPTVVVEDPKKTKSYLDIYETHH